jgi:pilus assembly protein Flp/PilA
MKVLYIWLARCAHDKRGQDMIEYALLAGFIAVVVAAFFPTQIGPSINSIFTKVVAQLGQTAAS